MKRKKDILTKIVPLQDVEAIQILYREMKELCLKAGISERKYKSILFHKTDENQLKKIKEFLIEVYSNEYKEFKKAYEIVPAHVWENYKLINETEMPEHKHLEEFATKLKNRWKERPKREKNEKENR